MAFQFMCPYGHLLQAEESQAGQQCQCPECGVMMLIPSPTGGDVSPETAPAEASPGGAPGANADAFPTFSTAPDFAAIGGVAPTNEAPQEVELAPQAPKVLHIPCPRGHILETPEEMVGQDALCPFCNLQFRLRYDDSLEHRREKEEEEERRQQRAAKAWLNWSIAAAVVVILGVILLFIVRASS
ncbi:MAG: hypothetical protein RBS80_09630 [Thermoguttaceae bacterium]|nr:hypothetical protein [Thermoguttaceae bacterium]